MEVILTTYKSWDDPPRGGGNFLLLQGNDIKNMSEVQQPTWTSREEVRINWLFHLRINGIFLWVITQ